MIKFHPLEDKVFVDGKWIPWGEFKLVKGDYMPVPKNKQKEYGSEVAAITSVLEKKGVSPSEANKRAKAHADKDIVKKKKPKYVGRM